MSGDEETFDENAPDSRDARDVRDSRDDDAMANLLKRSLGAAEAPAEAK